MQKLSLFLLLNVLLLAAFYNLHHVDKPIEARAHESLEESEAKHLQIRNMLCDPLTGEIPLGFRQRELQFVQKMDEQGALFKKSRSATWTSRGPWNVGGRTRTMAIDLHDENHLIAGAVSGGIWQSFNAGQTWQKVTLPNDHPGCVSITQDPRPGKGHIWYALSGELYGTSASGGGAFYLGDGAMLSTDNGNTWRSLEATAQGTPNSFTSSFQGGWRIAASPVDTVAACVYMATYGYIWRSTDTGHTWKVVLGGGNNQAYFTDVVVTSKGIVYAALSSGSAIKGFYRSGDGVNFVNITPSSLKSYDRTVIGLNPNNENEVFFMSELPSDTSGGVTSTNYEGTKEYLSLFRYNYLSGDGSGNGGVWTNLSANLPIYSTFSFERLNTQGGYDMHVTVQPGTNHIFIGGTNLYRSSDALLSAENTTQIGGYSLGSIQGNWDVYPNHHPDQHEVYFLKSDPNKAYSISDGGVRFTDNINAANVQWKDVSMGYITSQFYTVAIDESKAYDQWILGGLQDNGNYITRTSQLTSDWNMTINGDGSYNYIAPNRAFYIISTQLGNTRKVLLDERGSVLARRRIDPDSIDRNTYNFINQLYVDPNDNNTLYMGVGKRLGRLDQLNKIAVDNNTSKLNGAWVFSDSISTPNISATNLSKITAIGISKSPADVIYIGTNSRDIYKVENVRSNPMSLKKLSTFRLPSGGYTSSIAVDPTDANKVLICYSNYNINSLFYTEDGGDNWFLVGGNLEGNDNSSGGNPSTRCVNILVHPNGKKTYFCGTSVGLFSTDTLIKGSSSNNPTMWTHESPQLIGANVVTDIRVRQSDGYVVIATHGNGVFESYYTGNTPPTPFDADNAINIYPNPASSLFFLSFSNDIEQRLRADLIDVSGRKVLSISDQLYKKGTYTLKVPTDRLPNGLYFAVVYYSSTHKPYTQRVIVRH